MLDSAWTKVLAVVVVVGGCDTASSLRGEVESGARLPDAAVTRLKTPGDRGCNRVRVASSGQYAVIETSGPWPAYWLALDSNLREVARERADAIRVGLALNQDELLAIDPARIEIRSIPSLEIVRRETVPLEWGYQFRILGLPAGDDWLLLPEWEGPMLRLHAAAPFRTSVAGRLGFQHAWCTAIDLATNSLVVASRVGEVEAYDLATMERRFHLQLPCGGLSAVMAAGGGTAWTGTMHEDGRIFAVDLRNGRIARELGAGIVGNSFAACSTDGTELVTVGERRGALGSRDGRLVFTSYLVTDGELVECARRACAFSGGVNDVAFFGAARQVLVVGDEVLAWALPPAAQH